MAEITINSEKKIYARSGETLLDALRNTGIYVGAPCGGRGICGKCRGIVDGKETLLCRTPVSGDMQVNIENIGDITNSGGNDDGTDFADNRNYAAVIDIGSTTIKVIFYELESGRAVKSCSYINKQRSFGADVISRVEYAMKNGADSLYKVTAEQLENIITDTFRQKGTDIKRLRKIVVAGNTVMEHIFCREDISGFASYPFRPVFLQSRVFPADKLGYSFDAEVTVMPCASAFIGGDAVGGIMTCFNAEENAVFVDIGTNAEMAVFYGGRIYTASAAAGPAFEGGKISCGTGCIDGAVNHICFERGMVSVSTINKKPSAGICGSGLVDIAAEFLRCGIIDKSGRFNKDNQYSRYFRDKGFNVIRDIYISQSDIREIQLAKSAVYSGISTLLHDKGDGKINTLYLCGGIGEYINAENAVRIKFLPDMEIRRMGNTSVRGAEMVLFEDKLQLAEEIAQKCEEIRLAESEYFGTEFIENINF